MATKKITYNSQFAATAPSFVIAPQNGAPPEKSLLMLMFYYTYDAAGRAWLKKTRPSEGQMTVADTRATLTAEFETKFGIPAGSQVMTALIESHIAGDEFAWLVRKSEQGTPLSAQEQLDKDDAEKRYELNLRVIMDRLHDDAMGREFDFNW